MADVGGGWKMCDFAPTDTSSLGVKVLSKVKDPGIEVPHEKGIDILVYSMVLEWSRTHGR